MSRIFLFGLDQPLVRFGFHQRGITGVDISNPNTGREPHFLRQTSILFVRG
jgi:hypothetical protein